MRTIVVSSIGQELHDFWELVFPISDARQKTRFRALLLASLRFEICELVRTIVVSSIGQELHDFWELVLPASDARQKTRFRALVRDLDSVRGAHPTDSISPAPEPTKMPNASSSISEGWRWA
ncbi:hypothetical protein [Microcoleus sp. D3_18_C4]|uniref:hypothetical protein n=1 Tax=Microcoleus sp. D3_18_C4 TaxID=3055335 RepID=UPI002FD3F2E2